MIRLVQRKLILPRGDTGSFTIPVLPNFNTGDIAVFAIFNPLNRTIIFKKQVEIVNQKITIQFSHNETVNLPAGKYLWDIKAYINPEYADGELVNGDQIDSYYAGYKLPECQIMETSDNYLLADNAPTSTLSSAQLDIISAALAQLRDAIQKTQENVSHYPVIINEEWYTWDNNTNQYVGTGVRVPARISDLIDDSGHYIKPVNGIPASDIANGVIPDISGKQDTLTFDSAPTSGSLNPVTSTGIKAAVDRLNQDIQYYYGQNVTSIQNLEVNTNLALLQKQDTLTFDNTPTVNSQNPVTSNGIYNAIEAAQAIVPGTENGSVKIPNYTYTALDGVTTVTLQQNATGLGSFAQGGNTTASGSYSHAQGYNTIASSKFQHVQGQYNVADSNNKYAHITGIGVSNGNRMNGFTIDWSGNGQFKGKVTAGTTTISDSKDLTPKQYVDTELGKKQDTLTFDNTPQLISNNPVTSSGIYNAINSAKISVQGDVGILQGQVNSNANEIIDIKLNKQNKLTFDSAPTENSTNPVTSGGVYEAITNIKTMDIHICTNQEYDSQTGVPIIASPDTKTFYLVPGGEGNNLYIEWVYINNKWQQFGSATIDLSEYALKNELPENVSELINDANYLTSNGEIISQLLFTPTPLQVSILDEGKAITYRFGTTTDKTGYNASDYIDISSWFAIKYKRIKVESNNSDCGAAFYDANKTFISGLRWLSGQSTAGYAELYEVVIPENAKYARFTLIANTETYGEFELYGLTSGYYKLNQKQDKLIFDTQPIFESSNPVTSDGIYTALQNKANISTLPTKVSDLINDAGYITQHQDITGKADKVSNATPGNFTALDANGNLTDSRTKASDFLTDTDKTEILGKTLTPTPLPAPVLSQEYFIRYNYGDSRQDANYNASDYIDVSGWHSIRYKRTQTTSSLSVAGMAFYGPDKTFINDSGVRTVIGQDSIGYYGLFDVVVPNGAKYARFTMLADAQTYGAFELYGLREELAFDVTPTAGSANAVTSDGVYTAISSKTDKVNSAVSGNFAALDANGNLTDSGSKASDFLTAHQTIPVTDVQVNGTSVLSNGVANIPVSAEQTYGVIRTNGEYGVWVNANGFLQTSTATTDVVKAGTNNYRPIKPYNQHEAAFYGLAKAAGDTTQAQSSNAVGTYTNDAKTAIQTMLNVPDSDNVVSDVQIDGTSVVNNGVATLPLASASVAGVVKVNNIGVQIWNDGTLGTFPATSTAIKAAAQQYAPITPNRQHESVFYGLAKAAGDSTQAASNNAVGTYTTEAKAAIKSMLGVVGSTDYATSSTAGVAKVSGEYGLTMESGFIKISSATDTSIKNGANGTQPITTANQHRSVFYGLSKAAGDTTQKESSNAIGAYTDTAKDKIQQMLGIDDLIARHEESTASNAIAVGELFIMSSKLYKATSAIAVNDAIVSGTNCVEIKASEAFLRDVQVDGTSIVSNGVANVPIASSSNLGVMKTNTAYGLSINANGELYTLGAGDSHIKSGENLYRPVTPGRQHQSIFYGLAKAAGDTTQAASDNAVGTYTNGAKSAIQTMLNVPDAGAVVTDVQIAGTSVINNGVANIPKASSTTFGVIKAGGALRSGADVTNGDANVMYIQPTSITGVKNGTSETFPLSPSVQHAAAFYGLATAAGDTTQKASSNAVGTYTETAKSKIHEMFNAPVAVSGTNPVITGKAGVRYTCGTVDTLTLTPPASGIVDVVFTSGTTPTVLSVPNTVKWTNEFDPTSLDASTTYEINILDGTLGVVCAWT